MTDREKLIEAVKSKASEWDSYDFDPDWDYSTEAAILADIALAAFEKAHTPTDNERDKQYVIDADLDRFEATAYPIYLSTVEAAKVSKFLVSDLAQWVIRLVAEVKRLRRGAPAEPALIDCPHWEPGKITKRKGCTSCEASAEPAAVEVTDEMVERAARAWSTGSATPNNWENMTTRLQGITKDRMRAALEAALGLGGTQ